MLPIPERFLAVDWHDAYFDRLTLAHPTVDGRAQRDAVHIDVDLVPDGDVWDREHWRPRRLTFVDCIAVRVSLDLWSKYGTGHSISDAACEPASESQLASFASRLVDGAWGAGATVWSFTLTLCEPSGEVQVLARDFALAADGDASA